MNSNLVALSTLLAVTTPLAAQDPVKIVPVNRRPKRTPYRLPKETPFVERRFGNNRRPVRAGCGVGRA